MIKYISKIGIVVARRVSHLYENKCLWWLCFSTNNIVLEDRLPKKKMVLILFFRNVHIKQTSWINEGLVTEVLNMQKLSFWTCWPLSFSLMYDRMRSCRKRMTSASMATKMWSSNSVTKLHSTTGWGSVRNSKHELLWYWQGLIYSKKS